MSSSGQYISDTVREYALQASRNQGLEAKFDSERPDYTKEVLEEFLSSLETVIPSVRRSGDGTMFPVVESLIKNASTMKDKINTKRFEGLCGNRVAKQAVACSFFEKASLNEPTGVIHCTLSGVKPS